MATSDWDAYWRNAQSTAAHKDGGPQGKVLEEFWCQLFEQVIPSLQTLPRMLDIACGNGAVTRYALSSVQSLGQDIDLHISGLDESPSALAEMRKRYPDSSCVAGNASRLPFQDEAFDLVTSQFGMEYAGLKAFAEAARVVAPGGVIAVVLHLHSGGIYRECAINLEAIEGFRNCDLFTSFAGIFRVAMAVQQGSNSKEQFCRADERFAGSVAEAEGVLRRWGKGVADGMLFRLYTDIAHMYRRFATYDPSEVFTWIDLMVKELDSYSGRMASMLRASLDAPQLDESIAQLKARNFAIRVHDTLKMGQPSISSAWVVVADRPGS